MLDVWRTLVVAAWLSGAAVAAGLALWHLWSSGRPAPTPTIVAVTAALGFYFFTWPRVRGFLAAPSVFEGLMYLALALALAAFVLPVALKLQFRNLR